MNKLLGVLFVLFSVYVCVVSFKQTDSNSDIAHSIISEGAYLWGYDDISNSQNQKIENKRYKFVPTQFHKIKRALLLNKFDFVLVEQQIAELNNPAQRSLLYALLAKQLGVGTPKLDILIFKARNECMNLNWATNESFLLETISLLASIDNVYSQESAVDLFLKLPYSHEKELLWYYVATKKFSYKKLEKLYKAKSKNQFVSLFWRIPHTVNVKQRTFEQIEKTYYYAALPFSMSWNIKSWQNYKNPLLAYACWLGEDKEKYEIYREKSVSWFQVKEMQAGYLAYVEYAAKIFCITGDYKYATKLLNTLPNNFKKNRSLKRLARYFITSPEGVKTSVLSELY